MRSVTIQTPQETKTYTVDDSCITLMDAFEDISQNHDPGFEYDCGCKSGVCGSCAVRADEREVLACSHKLRQTQTVTPLRFCRQVRDLRVKRNYDTLKNAYIHQPSGKQAAKSDVDPIMRQSDCILCASCYSACPVFEVMPGFLGPFALTKEYMHSVDVKEADQKSHIDFVQTEGIWDCTLCGECTLVCPQGIDSKSDIIKLREKSVQYGYSDPNFQTMNFGF